MWSCVALIFWTSLLNKKISGAIIARNLSLDLSYNQQAPYLLSYHFNEWNVSFFDFVSCGELVVSVRVTSILSLYGRHEHDPFIGWYHKYVFI